MSFVDESLPDDVKVRQLTSLLEVARRETDRERGWRIEAEDALAHLLRFVTTELDPDPSDDWSDYFVELEHRRLATSLSERGDGSGEGGD